MSWGSKKGKTGHRESRLKPPPDNAGKCPYKIGDVVKLPPQEGFYYERWGKVVAIYPRFVLVDVGKYRQTIDY